MDDSVFWFFVALFFIIFIVLLSFSIVDWYWNFTKELTLLNMEIQRSHGREQRYWKARKKRLLLSLLPFVRYEE